MYLTALIVVFVFTGKFGSTEVPMRVLQYESQSACEAQLPKYRVDHTTAFKTGVQESKAFCVPILIPEKMK